MFTAWYRLIPYIKQITFHIQKVNLSVTHCFVLEKMVIWAEDVGQCNEM